MDNTDKFIVSQSNDLIEANYPTSMTARAHKTARLILSLISPDDKDLRTYTIQIDTLKQYLGMNSNTRWGAFYQELNDIQDKLNEQPIEIKKKGGGYVRTPFLGLDIEPKKGTVTFEISGLLKPYLLELKKNYTSYLLIYIPKLKSGYSIRLYELLHQYRRIGKRHFELDDLQRKVGSAYKKYSNFKIKVLKQAQKDLKEHTNLQFVFNECKQGRKVTGVDFVIFSNSPKQKDGKQLSFLEDVLEQEDQQEAPALSETIIKAMNELGISEQNIAKYLAKGFEIINGSKGARDKVIERCQTLENYYLEKLELTKNSSNKDNLAGFFIKALKEDWTNSKTLKKSKQNEVKKAINTAKAQSEQLERQLNKLSKQRKTMQTPIVMALIANDEILKTTHDAMLSNMSAFSKKFHAETLLLPIKEQINNSPIISSEISVHLMKTYPNHFEKITALDKQMEAIKIELKTLKNKHHNL